LRAFLSFRLPEGANLDYKLVVAGSIAETVAAMANTNGGTILVGVDEDKVSKTPVDRGGYSVDDPLGQLTNILRVYLDPVPPLETHVVPAGPGSGSASYLVVVVHPSTHRIVLHRDKGVLVRVHDQCAAPSRSDFERLLARERAADDEVAQAIGALSSGVNWHVGAGTAEDSLGVHVRARPIRAPSIPLDETLDHALDVAATSLLLPGWELQTGPKESSLRRDNEWVSLDSTGLLTMDFLAVRPGWKLDPEWAVNATDLASELVACLMLPFALAAEDVRIEWAPFAAVAAIHSWAGKSLFFPPSGPRQAPQPRPGPNLPGGPYAQRSGVIAQESDAVALAIQVVKDLARIYGVRGADAWALRLPGQLQGHNDRLRPWEHALLD
jgi:hypothetical protein